jgi:hypothetical protein
MREEVKARKPRKKAVAKKEESGKKRHRVRVRGRKLERNKKQRLARVSS